MNGREIAEQARRLRPSLPVLFTSGYARDAIVADGRLERGVELLAKPFSMPMLACRLRDLLDRKRPPSRGDDAAHTSSTSRLGDAAFRRGEHPL